MKKRRAPNQNPASWASVVTAQDRVDGATDTVTRSGIKCPRNNQGKGDSTRHNMTTFFDHFISWISLFWDSFGFWAKAAVWWMWRSADLQTIWYGPNSTQTHILIEYSILYAEYYHSITVTRVMPGIALLESGQKSRFISILFCSIF